MTETQPNCKKLVYGRQKRINKCIAQLAKSSLDVTNSWIELRANGKQVYYT